MNYIIFTGFVQAVLAVAFLANFKKKDTGDYLLIILLAGIAVHFATKFIIFNTLKNTAVIFRMHTCVQFGYGPLVYLHARKLQDPEFIPAKKWYLFIPLIIAVTLYACVFFGMSQLPAQATIILDFYNKTSFAPIVLSHIIYGSVTPAPQKIAARLKVCLVLLGFLEILLFICGNLNPDYNIYCRCAIYLLLAILPVIIIMNKISMYSTDNAAQNAILSSTPKEARRTAVATEIYEDVFNKLEELLQQKHLYKDEDLSLEKLCTEAGLNRHHVSETLNVFAKKSFYQYINEYRIKEVLRLLDENNKKARLLTIAYDSGFKTKASFNQYFKKITGITPTEYLKQKAV